MSLFWPPSLRICGGSHHWPVGHPHSGFVYRVTLELPKQRQGVRVKAAAPNGQSVAADLCNKIGTFETCRGTPKTSAFRGRSEVTGARSK
jgi:hypothetical protein